MSDGRELQPKDEVRYAVPVSVEPIRAELNSDYGEPTLGPTELPEPIAESASAFSTEFQVHAEPAFLQGNDYVKPIVRHPNVVDAALFLALLLLGLVVTAGALGVTIYLHWLERWFGLKDFQAAATDTRVALGTQLIIYLVAMGGAVPLFRAVWSRSYFAGLHWRWETAWRLRYRLIATAIGCNLLALVGNYVLPFPKHAPIDKMFSTERDAWLLTCFGVLLAPLFEEMIFRGFLIPAMATAWDWCGEKFTHTEPRSLDALGQPQWSLAAQIFSALIVSAPFALMHSAQVGSAWGPVSLLYCVSLILCAVRLATRSLAASTMVHATYNFMLFAVMFAQSGGFRHLDKL